MIRHGKGINGVSYIDWDGRNPEAEQEYANAWKTARHHRNQERKATMYRIVQDVSKTTRPALKRYERMVIETEIACREYKEATNVLAGDV